MQDADILIVEDDAIDQRFIRDAFTRSSHRVHLGMANDGVEALETLRAGGKPQLIVLDLNMPRMDGRALLRTLKDDEELRTIPVLVFSTSDGLDDISDCYHHHANAYLVKPDSVSGYDRIAQRVTDFWLEEAKLLP